MRTTVRGIRITRTSSSKPIAFSPRTAQLRKPVSGQNQQANKSLHAGSDSELGGEILSIPGQQRARSAGGRAKETKMSESTLQRNKTFVLEAFETLFNRKDFV